MKVLLSIEIYVPGNITDQQVIIRTAKGFLETALIKHEDEEVILPDECCCTWENITVIDITNPEDKFPETE